MKRFCLHSYKTLSGTNESRLKQEILYEDETGRFVKHYFLERCRKCGKERWWGFGKDWVWKGELSFVESINDMHRIHDETKKLLEKI